MTISQRIHKDMERLVNLWANDESYLSGAGTAPIRFTDNMAYAFFMTSLNRTAFNWYRRGVKHERRKRKQSCVSRHNRRYLHASS